jgi:catechol 2,3-dioxygenase-like lactoylglutathione lyase family enzyme
MTPAGPRPLGVYETVLYAEDVVAAHAFYADMLGLTALGGPGELGTFFRLPGGTMLLVFDPRRSAQAGRAVPSHGALGPGHVAFSVAAGELEAWRERFAAHGVAIEHEAHDPTGTGQLYVRDPAGNSVELVEGEIWAPPAGGPDAPSRA